MMSDQKAGDGDPTRDEVADYIGDMLHELRDLAKSSGLGTLTAILEIAAREAHEDEARPERSGGVKT
jgi:hypothetical protein